MASGHGVLKPNKANHPKRQVNRNSFGQNELRSQIGSTYYTTGSVTPALENVMSDTEWSAHQANKSEKRGMDSVEGI